LCFRLGKRQSPLLSPTQTVYPSPAVREASTSTVDVDLARVNAAFGGMDTTHFFKLHDYRHSSMLRSHDRQVRVRGVLGIGGGFRRGVLVGGVSMSEHMSRSSVYETMEAGLRSSTNYNEFACHCRRRRLFPASPSDGSTTKFRKVGVNLGNNHNPTIHQPVYIVDADTASLQHHHPPAFEWEPRIRVWE
jgi:hypothetical protein